MTEYLLFLLQELHASNCSHVLALFLFMLHLFICEKIDQFFKFQINTIAVFGTILILSNFYLLVR